MKTKPNKALTIEIRGCNFKNKGDVLMAESVIAKFSEFDPRINFVSRKGNTQGALAEQTRLGRSISPRPSPNKSIIKKIVESICETSLVASFLKYFFNITPSNEIDGVVDVCGFSYGDYWGSEAIESDFQYYTKAKREGKFIVLMPKSFGPFSKAEDAAKIKAICELADLCFVRDPESLEHLLAAGVTREKALLFPDFTHAALPINLQCYSRLSGRPAIIPNIRMADSKEGYSLEDYANYLVQIYDRLSQRYGKPFFIVHDIARDSIVIQRIEQLLNSQVETITEPVARVIKGIIGNCSFVYSDRLHGAISTALQRVPVCSTGWSHKYQFMLKDFGLEWALINEPTRDKQLKKLEKIYIAYHSDEYTKNWEAGLTQIKLDNFRMWSLIEASLKHRTSNT